MRGGGERWGGSHPRGCQKFFELSLFHEHSEVSLFFPLKHFLLWKMTVFLKLGNNITTPVEPSYRSNSS